MFRLSWLGEVLLFLLCGVSLLLRLVHLDRAGSFVSQSGFEESFERVEFVLGPRHEDSRDLVSRRKKTQQGMRNLCVVDSMSLLS